MKDLRASDADRELIVSGLRVHHAAGRLDDDEFEERLAAAFAARTRGELTRLVADLPAPEAPPQAAVVTQEPSAVVVEGDAEAAWRLVLDLAVPAVVAAGDYGVVAQDPPRLIVFEREFRPWWTWLIAVGLFPFGLLALLIRSRERTVVSLAGAGPRRTRVAVTGKARGPVLLALAGLRQ